MCIYMDDLIFSMESFTQKTYYDTFEEKFVDSIDLGSEQEGRYISIPKVDSNLVIRDYINQLHDKQARKFLLSRLNQNQFGDIFHKFINDRGLYEDYIIFYTDSMRIIAMDWCNDHSLKCTMKTS